MTLVIGINTSIVQALKEPYHVLKTLKLSILKVQLMIIRLFDINESELALITSSLSQLI